MTFSIDEYEESRCKFYGTSITSCSCPGFSFRKSCRHVIYMREKFANSPGNSFYEGKIVQGMDATLFVEKYTEEALNKLKLMGVVYEKSGKLFKI